MDSLVTQFDTTVTLLQKNLYLVLIIIAGLYVIQFLNAILRGRLNIFGVYPRKWFGLMGIVTSPFVHANFNHIFFNSIPFFVLASFVLLSGLTTFVYVSAIIIILSGIALWLFGRPGFHVGASGVIMGYWAYLMMNAYEQGTLVSIALAGVCFYYFGGLIFHLFPQEVRTSWEAHLFGFLAGIAAAFAYPWLVGAGMVIPLTSL